MTIIDGYDFLTASGATDLSLVRATGQATGFKNRKERRKISQIGNRHAGASENFHRTSTTGWRSTRTTGKNFEKRKKVEYFPTAIKIEITISLTKVGGLVVVPGDSQWTYRSNTESFS